MPVHDTSCFVFGQLDFLSFGRIIKGYTFHPCFFLLAWANKLLVWFTCRPLNESIQGLTVVLLSQNFFAKSSKTVSAGSWVPSEPQLLGREEWMTNCWTIQHQGEDVNLNSKVSRGSHVSFFFYCLLGLDDKNLWQCTPKSMIVKV